MPFEFGDVVLVPLPFTSQIASKKRPAVVVSPQTYNESKPDVVVMAITSQLRATAVLGEVWVEEWEVAGLLKPSAIKPVFATL
jgi:mRNA interferase MazF